MLNFLSKCAHVTQMLSHVPRKAGWVGVSSFLCRTSDSRLLQQVREKKKKKGGVKDDEGWLRLESDSCIVPDFLLCRGSHSVARESWQSAVRSCSPRWRRNLDYFFTPVCSSELFLTSGSVLFPAARSCNSD